MSVDPGDTFLTRTELSEIIKCHISTNSVAVNEKNRIDKLCEFGVNLERGDDKTRQEFISKVAAYLNNYRFKSNDRILINKLQSFGLTSSQAYNAVVLPALTTDDINSITKFDNVKFSGDAAEEITGLIRQNLCDLDTEIDDTSKFYVHV